MDSYMLRWKLKDETFAKLVATPVNRRGPAEQLIEGFGGKMESYHFAIGEYDGFAVASFPNSTDMYACQMKALATGAFERWESTLLITPEHAEQAMRRAGSADVRYRAPNS
jgi:uncharacterized protein with GYD domain